MEKFKKAELEIVEFNAQDVIATSCTANGMDACTDKPCSDGYGPVGNLSCGFGCLAQPL